MVTVCVKCKATMSTVYGNFEGLIFCGWQIGKDFHNLFSRLTCTLPSECIMIKEQFEDDNFTSSKVTTNYAKFCLSILTVCCVCGICYNDVELYGEINFDFVWCVSLRNFPNIPITGIEKGTSVKEFQ